MELWLYWLILSARAVWRETVTYGSVRGLGWNALTYSTLFDYLIYLFISAKRSIFFWMAQYNELPVYKATYDLLLAIYQFTKEFSKEYKYNVGESLKKETIELLTLIYRANTNIIIGSLIFSISFINTYLFTCIADLNFISIFPVPGGYFGWYWSYWPTSQVSIQRTDIYWQYYRFFLKLGPSLWKAFHKEGDSYRLKYRKTIFSENEKIN